MKAITEISLRIRCVIIFILAFVLPASLQQSLLPEIHQAAGLSRFTGIYSFLGSFIAIRELYFLVGLVTVLIAGSVLLAFFQLPTFFLPVHHIQRSQRGGWQTTDLLHTVVDAIEQLEEMVAGFIEGHPILSIPSPHELDHPGLTDFTSSSIVPMLRFYSFVFRAFIFLSLALILLTKPLFKFVMSHGKNAPAVFQNQTGLINFKFRSLSPQFIELNLNVQEALIKSFNIT